MTFREAAELAYFGAKVLHPATILPAVQRNIPVRVLNSKRPDVPGTVIVRGSLRVLFTISDFPAAITLPVIPFPTSIVWDISSLL